MNSQSIETVKAELGVPGLAVNISPADIEAQTTPEIKVDFLSALKSAINSFISDGNLKESPLWIVKELPGEYGLPDDVDEKTAREKVIELLNKSGCVLSLLTEAETGDEWAGRVSCEETGEIFGTTAYWIFELRRSPFTDINYAVVDKTGGKPTICWGFS